ncbi:MAG: hypothetical protein MSS69_11980 [Spirochaetales bacterium]|nr:hypothetical protein [Spirochaetales bacterium]
MNNKIIGREKEIKILQKCLSSSESQLIIVYGRRRVGKTFLVNNFFDYSFDFKVSGSYGLSMDAQINNFISEINLSFRKNYSVPTNWFDAFFILRKELETLPTDKKSVVFIDEMPWFDTPHSDFLPAFEYFWNNWGAGRDNLVCVVCGSATQWIVENISLNKGGLFNRQSCRLYLEPFTLNETEKYLVNKGFVWSRYDIAECYMIMGGIPYYLNFLDNSLTLSQNIDALFFKRREFLWDEFSHLYSTLFKNSPIYIKVVEALSKKRMGMTREEISKETGLPQNGVLTNVLDNLEYSSFIHIYQYFGKKTKDKIYQLSDYYTLFYFKFLKNNADLDENFWSNSLDNPSIRAWKGLSFELLCRDHISEIKKKLGIEGVLTETSVWFKKGTEEEKGAQIDLVLDRRDRIINLLEMKFSELEFEIDKKTSEDLINKRECFRSATKTKKALHITLVTTYGCKGNRNMIQSEVTLDDLFE